MKKETAGTAAMMLAAWRGNVHTPDFGNWRGIASNQAHGLAAKNGACVVAPRDLLIARAEGVFQASELLCGGARSRKSELSKLAGK